MTDDGSCDLRLKNRDGKPVGTITITSFGTDAGRSLCESARGGIEAELPSDAVEEVGDR